MLGCCCVYSLFNVTSLVIKLFLNFLIAKLNFRCADSSTTCFSRHRRSVRPCCGCCRPRKTASMARVVAAQDGPSGAVSRRCAVVVGGRRASSKTAPGGTAARSTRMICPLSVADLQRRQNGVLERSGDEDSAPSSRRSSNEVNIKTIFRLSVAVGIRSTRVSFRLTPRGHNFSLLLPGALSLPVETARDVEIAVRRIKCYTTGLVRNKSIVY